MIAVEADTDQQAVLDRVKKDPIWSQLPAVKVGHLVAVKTSRPTLPCTPIGLS
jgi:ABC-type Fe3+-hydroxamate transport system substrate-binding protein